MRPSACTFSDLPVYDYREALRPPTRFLPFEEEDFGEEEGVEARQVRLQAEL